MQEMLVNKKEVAQDMQSKVNDAILELEHIEESVHNEAKQWSESAQEHAKEVLRCEQAEAEIAAKISALKVKILLINPINKYKTEREQKYRTIISKLHKLKEANNKLDRRVSAKKKEVEDLKQGYDKEIAILQEQVNFAIVI